MWDVGNEVILGLQDHCSRAPSSRQQRDAYAHVRQRGGQGDPRRRPEPPGHLDRRLDRRLAVLQGQRPRPRPARGQLLRRDLQRPGRLDQRRLHQAVHRHRGRPGRRVGGPERRQRRARPSRPTCRSATGYTTAWNCITGHPGVALGATDVPLRPRERLRRRLVQHHPRRQKRLGYYAVAKAYGGTAASGPTRRRDQRHDARQLDGRRRPAARSRSASRRPTRTATRSRYHLIVNSKYINERAACQRGVHPERRHVHGHRARRRSACGRSYVFAYDGKGNVGIETRSFRVVPPAGRRHQHRPGQDGDRLVLRPVQRQLHAGPGGRRRLRHPLGEQLGRPEWIQVDLGSKRTFNHVQLVWEAAYAKAYQIQTSDDGTTWTTLSTSPTATAASTPRRHRQRALRADERPHARDGVRLLAVRVRASTRDETTRGRAPCVTDRSGRGCGLRPRPDRPSRGPTLAGDGRSPGPPAARTTARHPAQQRRDAPPRLGGTPPRSRPDEGRSSAPHGRPATRRARAAHPPAPNAAGSTRTRGP